MLVRCSQFEQVSGQNVWNIDIEWTQCAAGTQSTICQTSFMCYWFYISLCKALQCIIKTKLNTKITSSKPTTTMTTKMKHINMNTYLQHDSLETKTVYRSRIKVLKLNWDHISISMNTKSELTWSTCPTFMLCLPKFTENIPMKYSKVSNGVYYDKCIWDNLFLIWINLHVSFSFRHSFHLLFNYLLLTYQVTHAQTHTHTL